MLVACVLSVVGAGMVLKGPTLTRMSMRSLRHKSTCQSNLKIIGLGLSRYVRDYDEMSPPGSAWTAELMPYIRDAQVFQCPRRGPFSQGYAIHRSGVATNWGNIDKPAEQIVFFEADASGLDALDAGLLLPDVPRHGAGHNIGFADGHVKMLDAPDFEAGYDLKFRQDQAAARASAVKFQAEYGRRQKAEEKGRIKTVKAPEKP
jgi:prepilin-type processing-associated H-X9-DG protein